MTTTSKLYASRNNWKEKAVNRATKIRDLKKEVKRLRCSIALKNKALETERNQIADLKKNERISQIFSDHIS